MPNRRKVKLCGSCQISYTENNYRWFANYKEMEYIWAEAFKGFRLCI